MIKITAKSIVKAGAREPFIAAARELVEKSRAEAGNISYHLYEDMDDPNILTFIEEWKDQAAVDVLLIPSTSSASFPCWETWRKKPLKFPCTGKSCKPPFQEMSRFTFSSRRRKTLHPPQGDGAQELRTVHRQNAKHPHPEPQKSEYLGREALAAPSISMNAECMQPCSWQWEVC